MGVGSFSWYSLGFGNSPMSAWSASRLVFIVRSLVAATDFKRCIVASLMWGL